MSGRYERRVPFNQGGTPARILDVFETTGEAHTADTMHAELSMRFGVTKPDTVRQTMKHLRRQGYITKVSEHEYVTP